jgi:hypothetical protein
MIDDQDYADLQTVLQTLAGIIGRQAQAKAEREELKKKEFLKKFFSSRLQALPRTAHRRYKILAKKLKKQRDF